MAIIFYLIENKVPGIIKIPPLYFTSVEIQAPPQHWTAPALLIQCSSHGWDSLGQQSGISLRPTWKIPSSLSEKMATTTFHSVFVFMAFSFHFLYIFSLLFSMFSSVLSRVPYVLSRPELADSVPVIIPAMPGFDMCMSRENSQGQHSIVSSHPFARL